LSVAETVLDALRPQQFALRRLQVQHRHWNLKPRVNCNSVDWSVSKRRNFPLAWPCWNSGGTAGAKASTKWHRTQMLKRCQARCVVESHASSSQGEATLTAYKSHRRCWRFGLQGAPPPDTWNRWRRAYPEHCAKEECDMLFALPILC
jgi:hypothetical protein